MATNVHVEPSPDDFRVIAEGSCDWESWISPEESLRWTNAAGAAICGFSAAECRAMTRFPWPLVHKDDHITFELFDHYVGEKRQGNDLPVRIVRKDGSLIWVTASWRPVHGSNGAYQGVRLSIRDRSWSLHNRYLDHFRPVAIELLAEIMPAARAGDMRRVYHLMTERAARALGVARVGIWMFDEARMSLIATDRFSTQDYSHLEGSVLSLANCPRYRAALTGDQLVVAPDALNDPVTNELADVYLRPLGIASMLDAPIVRGGRTIGVICHEHVGGKRSWYETELAFVESLSDFLTLALYANEGAQLTQRNRMLASIVEVLPDPVVTVDLDGNPVYLNQAAYRTHEPLRDSGLTEFGVQHISKSYSPEGLKYRSEVIVPAALTNGYWHGEVRLTTKLGTEVPVWQTMVAHHNQAGELKLLTSILRDLREQKSVESRLRESEAALQTRVAERTRRIEQLNQELEAFSATMAHDLQAPLRSIDESVDAVLERFGTELPAGVRALIHQLSGSTARMRSLIDDLLLHSRTVRREPDTTRFSAGAIVRGELTQLRGAKALGSAQFTEHIEEFDISADEEFFKQIVRSLIDNAVKFSAGVAVPLIHVSLRRLPEGLQFVVKDNGCGFDMKDHDRIFGIFQRLHQSMQYPGTGIGLAIVAQATERMGGRVWAQSAPGAGAEFTFLLAL